MKKFTKGALIIALVFMVFGFTLCAVGAGIGFHYSTIPEMISKGVFQLNFGNWSEHWNNAWSWNNWDDDWESWIDGTTEKYDFSTDECADIQNLKLIGECGTIEVEEAKENQGIHVEVTYRKANTKRKVNVEKNGTTLEIEDKSSWGLVNNDNVHISIQIPKNMEFEKVELENSAGEITLNHALNAKEFSVVVGAGECVIKKDLQVSGKLYAEVDAGEIDFAKVSAEKIELNAGVGEIDVEYASADEVILDCGVGSLSVTLAGTEEDYSYGIDCGVGDVEIGHSSYSGLGTTKNISGGSKKVEIDCGVGEVSVDFKK